MFGDIINAVSQSVENDKGMLFGEYTRRKQNKFNATEARRNREFQERMVRKRYQYMMQDLEEAGLNPMLAVGGAQPATASGAQASASPGMIPSSNAPEYKGIDAQVKAVQEQTKKTKEEAQLVVDQQKATQALKDQYINTSKKLQAEIEALKRQNNWDRNNPNAYSGKQINNSTTAGAGYLLDEASRAHKTTTSNSAKKANSVIPAGAKRRKNRGR